MKNGQITVYTLAVKEIKVRHTGENLKKIILDELADYGILLKHIYTITSDNGANIVKAVNLTEDGQRENEMLIETEEDIVINDDLVEMILNAEWETDRIMSKLHYLSILFYMIIYDKNPVLTRYAVNYFSGVRCAAHVLQLCVSDTLKNLWIENEMEEISDTYSTIIRAARKVVVELRTQNVAILLGENKLKKPLLDCPTRYGCNKHDL